MGPERIHVAALPTPIQKIESINGVNIYFKRDDFTGIEVSGNKIRKLEYAVKEALNIGATVLITCGGIQSNHARATVALGKKLGLKVHLVLRGSEPDRLEGNFLINYLMGATFTFLNADDFEDHEQVVTSLKEDYEKNGEIAYLIPIGASNGIGNFGYMNCYEEILQQEKEMGITFDAIVCTVGSGGTYAGLFLGKSKHKSEKAIIGFNISSTAEAFKTVIRESLISSQNYLDEVLEMDFSTINIIDGYAGRGYALSVPEELNFIRNFAQKEGILLDPVYTGKAFLGLKTEIESGRLSYLNHVLFIHTGGLFGVFPFEQAFKDLDE